MSEMFDISLVEGYVSYTFIMTSIIKIEKKKF